MDIGLPIYLAWLARELRTLFCILHQFNLHAARITDPGLPAVITAKFFIADLPTLHPYFDNRCLQVLYFQAQMVQ